MKPPSTVKRPVARLRLGDYDDYSDRQLREAIAEVFEIDPSSLRRWDILIAWKADLVSYEAAAWFLLRDRRSGALAEVHAAHCSCHGFEGMWQPEPTSLTYLRSKHFRTLALGDHGPAIWAYIESLKEVEP